MQVNNYISGYVNLNQKEKGKRKEIKQP